MIIFSFSLARLHTQVRYRRSKGERVMVNRRKRDFTRLTTTLIGIVGVITLAGGLVFGQNFTAPISGFVRDTTGAVIHGTTVTAKHVETGLTRTVQTNEEGGYTMPQLPVGSYEITAENQASGNKCGVASLWLWHRKRW